MNVVVASAATFVYWLAQIQPAIQTSDSRQMVHQSSPLVGEVVAIGIKEGVVLDSGALYVLQSSYPERFEPALLGVSTLERGARITAYLNAKKSSTLGASDLSDFSWDFVAFGGELQTVNFTTVGTAKLISAESDDRRYSYPWGASLDRRGKLLIPSSGSGSSSTLTFAVDGQYGLPPEEWTLR